MSEESVESIFQHACEGAAESIGSTRVDWQRVVDAIRFLRRELEAAKQWGADLSNELTHRTTKLAEARLWLDSSESALQEAQRALFRWMPNRIGSEYDDLIAADAMALMGLESTEGLREVGNEILVELMEKRRLLDDARAQKPVAWRPKFDIEGDWSLGEPPIESIEYWHEQGLEIEYAYLRSAPVPAQPAAKTVCDALEITNAIILDVCETDPADPSHPETVCINVDDLRETVERHILTAKGDGT